jgi:type III restriction enzyme
LTDEKLLEREYEIPPAQTAEEVVGYYARVIAQNVKLPSQFAVLAPKIKEFLKKKAFGKTVDLNTTQAIKAMSGKVAHHIVIKEFEKILRKMVVEEKQPQLLSIDRLLSSAIPFPTSKKVIQAPKTIFNYVAGNDFELNFAKFLDKNKNGIKAFAKLPEQFGFSIQYTDTLANIRNYFPDFIAITDSGENWIIETKGREDIDVIHKDRAAVRWCEIASKLTGENWQYLKVPQKEFEKLDLDTFEELLTILNPPNLFD